MKANIKSSIVVRGTYAILEPSGPFVYLKITENELLRLVYSKFYVFKTGLRIFMQIHVFINSIKGMEPKWKFVTSLKYYTAYFTLVILHSIVYYMTRTSDWTSI